MAEGVDRLQLVADDDELGLRALERLDQPQLQAVGVLELVDQEVGEAAAVGLADLGPLEQAGGEDLQVLEVDPGAALLGGLEGGGVEARAARRGGGRRRRPSPASAVRAIAAVERFAEGGRAALAVPPGRSASSSVRDGGGPGSVRRASASSSARAFGVALLQLLEAFARRLDRARRSPRPGRRRAGRGAPGRRRRGCAARRGRRRSTPRRPSRS